jgi:hypothetical protein
VRRSTAALVGVLSLLGGIVVMVATTNGPGMGIGLAALGGLLLMTLAR